MESAAPPLASTVPRSCDAVYVDCVIERLSHVYGILDGHSVYHKQNFHHSIKADTLQLVIIVVDVEPTTTSG